MTVTGKVITSLNKIPEIMFPVLETSLVTYVVT